MKWGLCPLNEKAEQQVAAPWGKFAIPNPTQVNRYSEIHRPEHPGAAFRVDSRNLPFPGASPFPQASPDLRGDKTPLVLDLLVIGGPPPAWFPASRGFPSPQRPNAPQRRRSTDWDRGIGPQPGVALPKLRTVPCVGSLRQASTQPAHGQRRP